jgi:hypothetical protein
MQKSNHLAAIVVLMLAGLAGCGGSSSTPAPPTPTIGQVSVLKGMGAHIVRFKAGDKGDVAPQQEIGLPVTFPTILCSDVPHNRLAAITTDGTPIIVLIDNASSGTTVPRTISGAATTLSFPGDCVLDSSADLLYVSDSFADFPASNILVFGPASTVSGNIAPLRTISVPYAISGIAGDPANNRLFVADATNHAINIYDSASTLTGAAVPNRTISGPATQLSPARPLLTFESSGHLAVGFDLDTNMRIFNNAGSLNGNVAPSASFVLTSAPFRIAISPAGDLYVTDFGPDIVVYGNVFNASGAIKAVRIIAGPHTGLDPFFPGVSPGVSGIVFDPTP